MGDVKRRYRDTSVEAARQRMEAYFRNNPINFAAFDIDESELACKTCGRVIYCGDLNKMCSEPDCELKQRRNK
jgi:hypothetical protein